MADFKTHAILGGVAGVGISIPAFVGNFTSFSGVVLAFIFSIIASALPDIDSDTGSPRKFVLSALEILCPALVMVSFAGNFSLENLLSLGIVILFFVRGVLGFLIDKLTRHRGAWHSVPMALIFALAVYLAFYRSTLSTRIFFALVFLVSFILHLLLDEICSLKHLGLATKKSFGTALKFTGTNFLQTVLMYVVIVVLGVIGFLEFSVGGAE